MFAKELKDLLLHPFLVVGLVLSCRVLVHQAAQIGQLIDELEQLRDVVGDGRRRWIALLQVLLEHFADAYERRAWAVFMCGVDGRLTIETFVDGFVVGVRPRIEFACRLKKENGVRHVLRSSWKTREG